MANRFDLECRRLKNFYAGYLGMIGPTSGIIFDTTVDATGVVGMKSEIPGNGMMLLDGLYQVTTSYLCAGFVIEGGRVASCAPILRRRFEYWRTIAVKIV